MIHPIELESYRILDQRVDLSHLPAGPRAVVARIIHASADTSFAQSVEASAAAVATGVAALAAGAAIVADVEMTRVAISGGRACCHLGDSAPANSPFLPGLASTRSAAGMARAALAHPEGAVVVVGCAPTALEAALLLADAGAWRPALIIGLPVGFVGAAESKAALRASSWPSISNAGERGGAGVAAAAANALLRLASVDGGSGPATQEQGR